MNSLKHFCRFLDRCYCNTAGRPVTKVDRGGDVDGRLLLVLAAAPHNSPHVLGHGISLNTLIKL